MGSKICMNEVCRKTTSSEWKQGWVLKSGGFAPLCYNCGSAYEKSLFCKTFHPQESGWRQCNICGKPIHCGCVASRYLHEYLDVGGVGYVNCVKRLEMLSMPSMQNRGNNIHNETFVKNATGDLHPVAVEDRTGDNLSFERLLRFANATGASKLGQLSLSPQDGNSTNLSGAENTSFRNLSQKSIVSPAFIKTDGGRPKQGVKEFYEPMIFSLKTSSVSSSSVPSFPGGIVEGSELINHQGQRARQILPKPLKPSPMSSLETNRGTVFQTRIARPPVEGRVRNQLLSRYWPKITDQELKQLSGELKSTIVPLFEKLLSASDAGRIGRLVLPKACAEAYFPPINQSEGIPIQIQDIKGKEWTFQFRFWPNNNSRMYVLEGVTPCIQNMQLQAGDIVTFSRRDTGGQLVIGGRKETNNVDTQDPQTPAILNDDSPGETSFSGLADNSLSNGGKTSDDSMQQRKPISDNKKTRNIKNKRFLMHGDDVMDLRVTWEEAQELLRPSPNVQPTIVMIEDHAFEEYNEPPIFGKKTVFTSQPSGERAQLAQCDSCSKWRRLPVHVLLLAKWTCSENIWDTNRCSCSAPEDVNPRDLGAYFGVNKDLKRQRIADNQASKDGEPSGLDALATAAFLGDNMADIAEASVGATTKHPCHRHGCSCIVYIQPPSGTGKHEPTCNCNVCSTVKCRFQTLTLRKKIRQSEHEAEIPQVDTTRIELKLQNDNPTGLLNLSENEISQIGNPMELDESSKEQLDLNYDPSHQDNLAVVEAAGMSLVTLSSAADLPSETSLAKNGLPSLEPCMLSRTASENGHSPDDRGITSGDVMQENKAEDGSQPPSGDAKQENKAEDGLKPPFGDAKQENAKQENKDKDGLKPPSGDAKQENKPDDRLQPPFGDAKQENKAEDEPQPPSGDAEHEKKTEDEPQPPSGGAKQENKAEDGQSETSSGW